MHPYIAQHLAATRGRDLREQAVAARRARQARRARRDEDAVAQGWTPARRPGVPTPA